MTAAARLPRTIGTIGILLLTLSATTPASSLFVIVPGMVQVAGTGALWGMLAAGLVCLFTAFTYAELSSAFPNAGGEYVMVARTLGPAAGFVVLVINLFNNMIFPPVVGLGMSAVLRTAVPGLPVVPTACVVVGLATGSALLAIRTNALVTGLFMGAEVAALLLVVGLGWAGPHRSLPPMLAHPLVLTGGVLHPASLPAIGIATTIGIFALNGYGMAVYFGEEMRNAARRIARVVLLCFAIALALELAPLAAGLAGAPALRSFLADADPFGRLVESRVGIVVGMVVAVAVASAILNAAIVTLLASSRFLYATGRDAVWGAAVDHALCSLSRNQAVPWVATLVVGAIGIGCCFVSLPFLLVLNGAGLVVTYAAISMGALAGRWTGATDHAPYRMPLFPLAPALTVVALAGVIWASVLDPDEGQPGLIATAAQIAVAVAWYGLGPRRRGPWRPRDPSPEA